MKNKFLLLFLVLCCYVSIAQTPIGGGVINHYAQVTSIAGNTLSLGEQTGVAHTWAVGDYVMVIQMTGATESGGGLYQIQKVTAVNGNSITINGSMRAYDSPSAEKIQAVWVPYSCNGFTTSGTITALPWDGLTGGVVAMKSAANIALNGAVNANYAGYRPIMDTQTVHGTGLYGGGGSGAGSGGGGGGYGVPTGSITPQNSGVGLGGTAGGGATGQSSDPTLGNGIYGGGGSGGLLVQGFGGTYNGGVAPDIANASTNTNLRFPGGGGGGSYGGGGGGAGNSGAGGGGASPAKAGDGGMASNVAPIYAIGATNGSGWQNGSPSGAGGGGLFTGGSGGNFTYFDITGGAGGGYIPAAGYKNFLNTTDPRLFMGGSGSNNDINGGGIVFIDAPTLSAMTNYTISANGADGNVGGTNGNQAFGAGAGGNIVLTPKVLNPVTVTALGGNGVLGGTAGTYPNRGSGGGGGGGIWLGGTSGGSNINAMALKPNVTNVSANVNGGIAPPGIMDPKLHAITAGGGGEGIIVADPNINTAFTNSIGFGNPCSSVTAPVLGTTTKSNVCPATTVNLMNGLVTSTCPSGTNLEWHTTNVCLDPSNLVSNQTAVGAGTYYAVCYDATNMCYGAASVAETVTITNPCPITDLTTLISPTPIYGNVGGNSTYNVAMSNVGTQTSAGTIAETVTLPPGVNYVSGGGNGWNLVSQVGQVLTFANTGIALAPGATSNFPLTVSPTSTGTFNTNAVISGGNDSNPANNNTAAQLIVAGTPDLTTTITPPSATTVAGTNFNYVVNENNIGTGPSVGPATETVTLPAGLNYVSGGGNGWNLVSQVGQVLTFTNNNPALASGGTSSFPLVVNPSTNGTYTTPVAIAGGGETNTTNNTSSAVLTATPVLTPDLTTVISPAIGTGTAGVPYNYNVNVSNVGNTTTTGPAQEVVTLPAGLNYVSGGGNGWNLVSQVGQVLTFANANPNLASMASSTFPMVVQPTTSGTYTTPVVVSGGGETNTTNNNSSAVLNASAAPVPDLTTTITPPSATTVAGTNFNYIVNANNTGNGPTVGPATETITLPAGLNYVSGGGNGWNLTSQNGQVLTFTNSNPALASGATSSFPLVVKPTSNGTYTTPVVIAGGGETNTTNNTSSAVLTATPVLVPDLATVISPAIGTGTAGVPYNYSVNVSNVGNATTTGPAQEVVTLPAGLNYVSGGGNGWNLVSQVGQVLTFANSNPNLASMASSTFPMVVQPTTSGTYTTPVVVSGGGETNTTNNNSSAVLNVNAAPVPDLTTVLTASTSTTTVGTPVNYTVTSTNIGQATTTGPATQTVTIPNGLNYVSGGGNGWVLSSQNGNVLTFTNPNPNLGVGGTSSFPMVLTPNTTGTFTTPNVVGGGGETNTSNNNSSAVLTVNTAAVPDLTNTITPSTTTGTAGTPINYTVATTNIGNATTTGPLVQTLTMPTGMNYTSGGGNGWTLTSQNGQVLTFTNPGTTLAPNASSSFPIVLTPTSSLAFTSNVPVVVSGGGESNTSNNTASAIVNMTVGKISLLPKIWLQGALFGVSDALGIMRDDLRVKNLIPTTSPYNTATSTPVGNMAFTEITPTGAISAAVLAVTGNNAIVDWVWVELRNASNPSQVVDSRSALVQRDGDIVGLDGVSNVTFNSTAAANYYVAVKHRNHLGVMTKSPIALSSVPATVDFRQPSTPVYTLSSSIIDQAEVVVAQGVALWAGNSLFDKNTIYQGTGNDVTPEYTQINVSSNYLGTPYYIYKSYNNSDINMDGNTIFQGTGNDVNFVYTNVLVNHPGNVLKANYFIIKEQIP